MKNSSSKTINDEYAPKGVTPNGVEPTLEGNDDTWEDFLAWRKTFTQRMVNGYSNPRNTVKASDSSLPVDGGGSGGSEPEGALGGMLPKEAADPDPETPVAVPKSGHSLARSDARDLVESQSKPAKKRRAARKRANNRAARSSAKKSTTSKNT